MATQEELLKIYPKEQIALNPGLLNPDYKVGSSSVIPAPITSDSLASTPTPQFQTGSNPVVPSIKEIDTTLPETPKTTEASTSISSLTERMKALLGETAFKQQQETSAGLPELQKAQTDIAAQIKGLQVQSQDLQNQYNVLIPERMQQQATGRGITAGGLAPLIASEQRKNLLQQGSIASQALTLQASFEAIKGNLANAQALADRAVVAKYGPIKEDIVIKQANLELLLKDPQIDQETKNRAAAQALTLARKKAETEKQEKNTEEALKIANTAAQNAQNFIPTAQYPSVATALNAIGKADPISALQIAAATGLIQKQEKITGDIGEFKSFFPNVDITTPAGRQQFLDFQRQRAEVKRKPTGIGAKFTDTQINKGASIAELPIADFQNLDIDTQNFFINNSDQIKTRKKFIDEAKIKKENPNAIEKEISESTLPDSVKDTLTRYLKRVFPTPEKSSSPWWKKIFGF